MWKGRADVGEQVVEGVDSSVLGRAVAGVGDGAPSTLVVKPGQSYA